MRVRLKEPFAWGWCSLPDRGCCPTLARGSAPCAQKSWSRGMRPLTAAGQRRPWTAEREARRPTGGRSWSWCEGWRSLAKYSEGWHAGCCSYNSCSMAR